MAVLLPDRIGMVERRGRLRLPLEAGQGLGVFGDVITQKLQSDKTGARLRQLRHWVDLSRKA